ncbi:MAG: disulfide bond formation protein B [Steroidobacteraceae bacterium]
MPHRRLLNLAGFLAAAAMLGYAFYAEKILHLEPCPLCMFQRVGVAAVGVAFLLAALHHPASRRGAVAYAVLISIVALFPAYVAGRHVYIQSLPEGAVPSCGATLDYMLEVFPLFEVIRKVLTGGGECTKIDWSLLGLSMPAWVLIGVLALVVLGWFAALRRNRPAYP